MKPASPIHLLERDYFLHLDKRVSLWPPDNLPLIKKSLPDTAEPGWVTDNNWMPEVLSDPRGGYLWRKLTRKPDKNELQPEMKLWEAILRFPSAPLFGLQNKTGFQVVMQPIHQHTLRLLTSGNRGEGARIKKLFLIFNGLNELDYFDFYYDLAALLIEKGKNDSDVACLICPFPAHLTRYPLIGKYAEKPLQRFITDPSDLFRQYLRFMVETQWLISTLVPVSSYPVTCGIPLLEAGKKPDEGRCKTEILSSAIYKAWQEMFKYAKHRGPTVLEEDVRQSVAVIRHLIGWQCSTTKLVDRDPQQPLDDPQLHVIGYSLGGYLAQCVFFTWPFAIGSCTTLCSGGALRDLRLEKIIHEEEWRAITHGLQYEIESGILEGRIAADKPARPKSVCGIPLSHFTSHFQTFNDIFLQDPQGSYRHRVSEFAPRLFFVVGGNDPIVPTRSVLDTSPPEGINMIEIANLSHFLRKEVGEWPNFWLPTIAGIISSLSEHSEWLLRKKMLENLWNNETTDGARNDWLKRIEKQVENPPAPQRPKSDDHDPDPLDSQGIQMAILDLVRELRVNGGALLILRNQIPVTLMGPRVLHRRGSVPHYADFEIRRFWERLQEQRLQMLRLSDQITVVIPARLNEWFGQRPSILSAKHLPVVREGANQQRKIWKDFLTDWENKGGALYRFNPEHPKSISKRKDPEFDLERMIRNDTATPDDRWILNCLPDTWISLSQAAVENLAGKSPKHEELRKKLIERMCEIHTWKNSQARVPEPERKNAEDPVKKLRDWIEGEDVRIIRISAAQWSPRFLGERIWNLSTVISLMTHTALALARSRPCFSEGEFEKGWYGEHRG